MTLLVQWWLFLPLDTRGRVVFLCRVAFHSAHFTNDRHWDHVVVPLPPLSQRRRWRVVGWADILLDVISGVESALREGCPRTMTGVSQYWFSGHFRQVFSTPMHYPTLTFGTNEWSGSSIMTGVC
jgi:hypothetical protein